MTRHGAALPVAVLAAAVGAGCEAPRAPARPAGRAAAVAAPARPATPVAPSPAAASPAAPSPAAPAAAPRPEARCDGDGLARTCVVSGLFADAPATRLTLATGEGVPDTLVVAVARPGEAPRRLPTFYGSRLWGQCSPATDDRDVPRLDRLAADDVDGDGRQDLVVVAACMTGIGPTGARPFPAGAVYLGDARGGYAAAEPVDSALTDLAQAACSDSAGAPLPCDVRALARRALRVARP